jgi:hypothetical protein
MGYEDGGAAVGVDGNYSGRSAAIDVRGSFAVAGFGTLQIAGNLEVFGDLFAAGNVSVTGSTDVWRNAWLGWNFSRLGPFTVGGDLHHAGTVEAQPLSAENIMRETK